MLRLIKKKAVFNNHSLIDTGLVTFLNPVSYLKARKRQHLYQHFDYMLADGWLFVVALRMAGIHTQRYSFDMTSLASKVIHKAVAQEKSIYFLGAKPDEIECFIHTINTHFPGLIISGYRNGYFVDDRERMEAIYQIKNLAPDIVIVGLGVPLQEQFLVDLQQTGWNGSGYTCGGFIHQTTARLNYYPDWVNKYHLRMPYRFFNESHFRKRLPDYLKFLFIFAFDCWKYKREMRYSKI